MAYSSIRNLHPLWARGPMDPRNESKNHETNETRGHVRPSQINWALQYRTCRPGLCSELAVEQTSKVPTHDKHNKAAAKAPKQQPPQKQPSKKTRYQEAEGTNFL